MARNLSWVAIETLESRTFLSASAIAPHRVPVITPAIKVRATVPALANSVYSGPVIANGGASETLVIEFTTESKSGALHGTMGVTGLTGTTNFVMTGTVTKARKVTLRGHGIKLGLTITGAVSADLSTITGKYAFTGAKKNAHGAVTVTQYANF